MKKNLKIIYPFLIYCLIMLVFYFSNLFKINNYTELLKIIGTVLFAGLFEEFIFRLCLQKGIARTLEKKNKNPVYSVFITAILFGLTHVTNLIGNDSVNLLTVLLQSLSAIGGGLVLGSIYYKSNNYFLVAGLHTFYNFVIIIASRYCALCSANITLELILQIIFNFLICIYLLNDSLFKNKKINSKKSNIIYNLLFVLVLIFIIFLWRR